jgi:hypothetical protein
LDRIGAINGDAKEDRIFPQRGLQMFTIDADYNIATHEGPATKREDVISFSTQKGFGAATANWTTAQFVDLWNSFAGAPPFGHLRQVTKFMDRNTAIKRVWNALQEITPPALESQPAAVAPELTAIIPEDAISTQVEEPMATAPTKKAAKAPRKAAVNAPGAAKVPRHGSRKETVLALIGRKHGATLAEIMETTGWQAHSVRGFIATLGTKHGCTISSTKNEAGERVYQGA